MTINPGSLTDTGFYRLPDDIIPKNLFYRKDLTNTIPKNLMFVRIRTNTWNTDNVVIPAVKYYTEKNVRVILTFMAYYTESIPENHKADYKWEKRTLNSYWILNENDRKYIEFLFQDDPLVYTCGWKGTHPCHQCGNCLREYYRVKELLRTSE